MNKHAYLIMAHNNFDFLKKELLLLDDERNDIFIHVDKKAKDINMTSVIENIKKSKVYFIPRRKIKWAGYSGIQCELELLRSAIKEGQYAYYHLLSGADLPLKSQDEIHEFFFQHQGKEFVSFDRKTPRLEDLNRAKRYYFFQEIYGRNRKNPILLALFILDKISIKAQKVLNVNRFRKEQGLQLQKGPNWFSITHELALYVLKKEPWIKRYFSYTRSGDEVFLQTIVNNSKFKERLYQDGLTKNNNACLRKIDWGRGKPYVWRVQDYEELINSGCLFARKFDPGVDEKIINMLYDNVMKDEK
ncbi:MAG: glycosyl transferase [Lachnospiraceae bacterium]|nr:glycosyl transferase [Lachnospiraceae bacterium]